MKVAILLAILIAGFILIRNHEEVSSQKDQDIYWAAVVMGQGIMQYPCCGPEESGRYRCLFTEEFRGAIADYAKAYDEVYKQGGREHFVSMVNRRKEELELRCKR